MRDYLIQVDVLEAVQDFYPGLSVEDATQIADSILDKWDFTQMYNSIADDISWYADSLDIELEGKDGVEIPAVDEEEAEDKVLILNPPPSRLFP